MNLGAVTVLPTCNVPMSLCSCPSPVLLALLASSLGSWPVLRTPQTSGPQPLLPVCLLCCDISDETENHGTKKIQTQTQI